MGWVSARFCAAGAQRIPIRRAGKSLRLVELALCWAAFRDGLQGFRGWWIACDGVLRSRCPEMPRLAGLGVGAGCGTAGVPWYRRRRTGVEGRRRVRAAVLSRARPGARALAARLQ